jgi:hypothetical protein
MKIVKLDIVDNDFDWRCCDDKALNTYYLIDPDETKLAELKNMIEHRFDTDGLTDEEIEAKEKFCDFIWDEVEKFINENFNTLDINETYEIAY